MAFSMCQECGQFITGDATTCPNCGAAIAVKPASTGSATGPTNGSDTANSTSTDASSTSSPSNSYGRESYSAPASTSTNTYYTMAPASRSRGGSKGKVIGIIVLVIVLVAAIGGGVAFFAMQQNSPENITAKAQAAFDQGDYEQANTILAQVNSLSYPPAKTLLTEIAQKQVDTFLAEGDYTGAFAYLDELTIRDTMSIDKIYEDLQYEAMAIQCLSELLVNVPNPDAIEITEVLIYYPSQSSIDIYGKVFPKCYFVLKGQAENDELTYWEFGPNDTAMMFDYYKFSRESLLQDPNSTDDMELYLTAMLMKADLEGSEPLYTSDGAHLMTVIEKNTYKDIKMPDYMEMEAFEE